MEGVPKKVYRDFFDYSEQIEVVSEFKSEEPLSDMMFRVELRDEGNEGSGWKFEYVKSFYIYIHKYSPISGSSYVELPDEIRRYCINVKNNDNECFKWAILSKEHNTGKLKELQKSSNQYEFNYPMLIKDIPRFERKY